MPVGGIKSAGSIRNGVIMKSFRSKMICILLAMSLIPLVMAVIYSYRISSRNLYEKMNQTEVAFVESMAHVVEDRKSVV